MRIEQYFLMTDYALWEVILNGDSPLPTRTVDGVETTVPPTTADQKLARKNELKARAIEKRFGGNTESKKVHKTLPKQQYDNFNGKSSKGLDQIYDNVQKLINQLEIHGETISQEDLNMKLLRSLPSEWKTHTLIWRNKPDLETLSMDDLCNNLKIYEAEVMGPQLNDKDLQQIDADDLEEMDLKWQMAMLTMRARRFLNKTGRKISANGSKTIGFNKSKTKALVAQDGLGYDWSDQAEEGPTNFAHMAYTSLGSLSSDSEVSTCSKTCLKSYETLKEHYDNLTKDFNKSQLNVGAYKAGLESVEARLDVYKKNEVVFEEDIKILKLDIKLRDNALTELRKKFKKAEKERDELKLTLEKFENSSKNLSKLLDSQVCDKFKTGVGFDNQVVDSQVVDSQVFVSQENDRYKTSEGYNAVPSPYTGNFMPLKSNLVLTDEDEYVFSESITSIPNVATSEAKTSVSKPIFAKVEFVKSKEHVKTPRESVKEVENNKQAKYPRKNSQSPRGNQRNWNNLMTQKLGSNFEFKNKACYVCGSFNHLIKDCDFHEKKMVEKPVWNNASRVNHQNSHRLTHPHPKRNFVPRAVLMKSGLKTLNTARQNSSRAAVSVNTARPINTAYPKPTVNYARPASNVFNKAHTHIMKKLIVDLLHLEEIPKEVESLVKDTLPIVKGHTGNGPNWLYDLDALTISMNYKPVVAGNQTNGNACTKENINAGQDGKKLVHDQKYILLPLLTSDPLLSKNVQIIS
ncbi:ribonuclease H-like domain-containing protein [Tanacetum coccineum]